MSIRRLVSSRNHLSFMLILLLTCAPIGPYIRNVSADDLPVAYISGTLASDQTWSPDSLYVISNVDVPNGVTLTIEPGTIIKVANSADGIRIDQGGVLNASGVTLSPIVITSYDDDSAGGDTNGNGASSPFVSYGTAIDSEYGGTVDMSYTEVAYASLAVSQSCATTSSSTFTDNIFRSSVYIAWCSEGQVTLARNQFDQVTNPLLIQHSDATIAAMAGVDENSFAGVDSQRAVSLNDDTVPTNSTWAIDSTTGAVFALTGNLGLSFNSALLVEGNLDIGEGVVLKTYMNAPIEVDGSGAVVGDGTDSDPIIFTSYKDDSVGGDTNNNGSSTGAEGDYTTAIYTYDTNSIEISHADFEYAGEPIAVYGGRVALSDSKVEHSGGIRVFSGEANFEGVSMSDVIYPLVVSGGNVTFRGTFDNVSGKAIEACDWGGYKLCG